MRGLLRVLTVTAIVIVIGSAALATPSVTFTFDPATYTYTYQVTLLADSGDDLSQFTIDAFAEMTTSYTQADVVNIQGTSSGWLKTRATWYDSSDNPWTAYRWWNGSANRTDVGWIGDFSLTINDSHPVDGSVVTKPVSGSAVNHSLQVPMSNALPEPGTLMGIGAMLLGLAPVLKKIRKK